MLRSTTLLGRERERALIGRLTSSNHGRGGSVLVIGDAGLGKSALVRSAVDADRLLMGRSSPSTAQSLAPVVELALGLVDGGACLGSAALGVYRPAVEALLPELTGGPDRWHGEVPQPVVLADALLRLWSTVAVPQRPVLLVEDLHWAGEGTWAVLQRLCRRAPSVGAVLVMTSRPEGPWWSELQHLARTGDVVDIPLAPLPPDQAAAMVADCLCTTLDSVPPGLLAALASAGGLPLLIEELLSDLQRAGALTREPAGWVWREGLPVVPASIEAGTRHRLGGLASGHVQVIEHAAVLGARPDLELLAAALVTSVDAVATAVRAGVDVGLLDVDPVTGQVGFRHDLVRDAVLAGVLLPNRREHASRLFEALLGRAGRTAADPGDGWDGDAATLDDDRLSLAAQLSRAARHPAAGRLQLAVGRRLLARGLPLAAAEAAETATRVAGVGSPVGLEALACQVEALALAGEVERALAAADRLEALPGARLGPAVREAVARATAQQGDWVGADEVLVPLRGPDEAPTTTALSALVALEQGRVDEAHTLAHRALGRRQSGPAACQALEVLGRLARARDLDQAQRWFRRCVAVAEADGLTLWRARALHEDATIEQLRTLDVTRLRQARVSAEEAGAPGLVSAVDFHLAAVLGVRFESADALLVARRLLADARTQGADRLQAWAWLLIGQGHAVAGRREQAELAAAEALALAPDDPEVQGVAVGVCRALPSLLADDTPTALQQWRASIEALRRCPALVPLPPWYLWPVLATVADPDGDGGAAARAETSASELRVVAGVDGIWHLARAVAAGRLGDVDAARADAATRPPGSPSCPTSRRGSTWPTAGSPPRR